MAVVVVVVERGGVFERLGWAAGGGCGLCRARVRLGLGGAGLSRECRGEGWRRGSGRCGGKGKGWWGVEWEGRCWWT